MANQFRETAFNKDCVHHTSTFSADVKYCPYCCEPSHRELARQYSQYLRYAFDALIVAGLLYLFFRGS